MKQKLPLILIVLILITGLGIFFYPTASDIISRITSTTVIKDYQRTIETTDKAEMEAMYQAAVEYNKNLPEHLSMDPFGTSSEEPYAEDGVYNQLLSVNGVMGYVDIPRIDIYLPVYHGTSEEILQKGAGHLYGSALPVGGEGTHSIISAHRGLPAAKLFTDLDQMKEGDVFYFHVLDRIIAYEVDQIKVVEPTELEDLNPVPREDYMTLFTCTPYGINSHRMLVRGHRIPYEVTGVEEPEIVMEQPPKSKPSLPAWVTVSIVGTVCLVIIIMVGGLFGLRKRKIRKKLEREIDRSKEKRGD